MEPLKPAIKKGILQAAPTASLEDLAEYERLLAERFTVDPDLPRDAVSSSLADRKKLRLKELHRKLFPAEEDAEADPGTSAGRS